MKIFLIFFLSFFIGSAFAQEYPDSGFTNKAEAKNLMVNGKKEGKWVEYTNGQKIVMDTMSLYRLTVYKEGKPYGIVKEYNCITHTLFSICHFLNGKETGIKVLYFEGGEGAILAKIPYANGLKNGVEECYYGENQLMQLIPFKDDKIEGIEKAYYQDGKLRIETSYSKGMKNGKEKNYEETGQVSAETIYKNDTIDGAQKLFDINGNLVMEIVFKQGIKNGTEKEYYENGKIKSETNYVNGVAGKTKNFDENGNEIK